MTQAKKKIFSCVVSYRDPARLELALKAQAAMRVPAAYQMDIVVVDNSVDPETHKDLRKICEAFGAQFHPLAENLGVSGAYAYAGQVVVESDYSYLWLWDQDSLPPSNCLQELLATFEREDEKKESMRNFTADRMPWAPLGMVGPKLMDPELKDEFYIFYNAPYNLNRMRGQRFPMEWVESGEVATTYLVNSGSLIHRDVIAAVGGPDTDFFMDLVDFEYSSKVVSAGFRIVVNANSVVNHRVGLPLPFKLAGRTLLGRNYVAFRYYYQARNDILLSRMGGLGLLSQLAMINRVLLRGVRIYLTERNSLVKLAAHYVGFLHGLVGLRGRTHAAWMMQK